jgi:hypothetical protein
LRLTAWRRDDHQGLDEQRERRSAFDRGLEAVVGLARAGDLLAVLDRGLDRYVCS